MKNLDDIIEKIDTHINEKDKTREQALRLSRDIIIGCRKAIQSLHRDLTEDAKGYIKQASDVLANLYRLTKGYPDLFHAGFVENASQEYVEANCLYNIVLGKELPDPDELQTTYSSYLMGLCDVVGELRRSALDFILEGDSAKANKYLDYMDKIYDAIMRLDYPSGLVPIKRKQDMVRSLIEKTKGELAIAVCERRIEDKTDEFRGLLDRISEEKKVKKQRREKMDIDVDKVW
jgi:translin